jgi:tetratricopeptide (TPR) repeat protein
VHYTLLRILKKAMSAKMNLPVGPKSMLQKWVSERLALAALISVSLVARAAPVNPSPAAKANFTRGEKELNEGRNEAAITAYDAALKATPKYAPALNGKGSALFKLNKRDEAIASFKAATDADPTFKLAWFNLGYATRKTGDFKTAAMAYEKYTALDPADADGFYGLAESYKQLGMNPKAVEAYETYVAKENRPDQTKWVDKAKEAIASLKGVPSTAAPEAVAVTPAPVAPAAAPPVAAPAPVAAAPTTAPVAQLSMPNLSVKQIADGDAFMAQKKYRDATFAYQDAVNADPQSVEAHFKLGNSYAVLGYYSQAIDQWKLVKQLSAKPEEQKSAQANIDKAQAKIAQAGGATPQEAGRPAAAGPVAEVTRSQARQAYEQGVQLVNQRRYSDALVSFNSALRLEPTLTVGYIARGSALIGLRRFPEAATDYDYALKLDASLSSPLYGLAEAYRGLNRVDEARGFYQRYISSNATDVRPELQADARNKLGAIR